MREGQRLQEPRIGLPGVQQGEGARREKPRERDDKKPKDHSPRTMLLLEPTTSHTRGRQPAHAAGKSPASERWVFITVAGTR
jgi:hypothetical protein